MAHSYKMKSHFLTLLCCCNKCDQISVWVLDASRIEGNSYSHDVRNFLGLSAGVLFSSQSRKMSAFGVKQPMARVFCHPTLQEWSRSNNYR
ncbi:hypothetical protein L873DRAFT_324183 [Choiromyces venosus 120613-1]|uniref:Uncharacterized protein n=1 Tax=Choiromyces venosus 120613-1 TaxID=1336337 RepID=A0A3N4K388_9PEZI|nr:hypothetical protein L873DRAFT_324183 [Choiromyces venosus 120613-1]